MARAAQTWGKKNSTEYRSNSAKRGYDHIWRKFRKKYLQDNPLCMDCNRDGRVTAALEVHHIKKVAERPDLRLSVNNCMALCKACHSRRTAMGE